MLKKSLQGINRQYSCGEGGIGHAMADEFLIKGYTVITTLLSHESRNHLTDAGINVFTADVTKDEDTIALRDEVIKITGGGLDVLVNNA
ncbi:hypothetical protein HYALB_00011442 [Hymenoscyphus albidus]|uniref:Uncharacterized protein n=1 Tax=Hymenoscyphus albidus TaxID=595503 RepID=A0A9N9LRN9_9HELO|nr:hypothetical protein HYALB_00011442 [Hymenoscyphus albidus]